MDNIIRCVSCACKDDDVYFATSGTQSLLYHAHIFHFLMHSYCPEHHMILKTNMTLCDRQELLLHLLMEAGTILIYSRHYNSNSLSLPIPRMASIAREYPHWALVNELYAGTFDEEHKAALVYIGCWPLFDLYKLYPDEYEALHKLAILWIPKILDAPSAHVDTIDPHFLRSFKVMKHYYQYLHDQKQLLINIALVLFPDNKEIQARCENHFKSQNLSWVALIYALKRLYNIEVKTSDKPKTIEALANKWRSTFGPI